MSDSGSLPTTAVEAPQLPFADAVIGERYRILSQIGEGGMGSVYRAEHVLMKKVVAIKILHPALGTVPDAARRFEREAQSASRLNHPNIIGVTDFGRAASGQLFLVMEHVPGESLAAVLDRERTLAVPRAVRIAREILSGLEHAHTQGVIHRDLKPANIMLTPHPDPRVGETVKILDFGIAKMTEGGGESDARLTRGAMVFGTPSYMSPEQATAQDADARADLYSCAVILYEMLSGRKPFVADDLVKVMAMQVTASPPRFSVAAPEAAIPADLESVVMHALEKDRDRRFASATEFRQALASSGADAGGVEALASRLPALWSPVSRAVGRALGRLPQRARGWVTAGAVAAVVLALTVVPMICSHEGRAPTATPPAPKPIDPEQKIPFKRIEEAMATAQLTEARLLIMQQLSRFPQSGRVRYLLGSLEFAEKHEAAGLEAYTEALRLDPGLRGDAALLHNIRSLLEDRRLARDALDVLVQQIGKPAAPLLANIASDDRRPDFRQAARAACESLGCSAKIDYVQSYSLDLQQAKDCDERRAAVMSLAATKDQRAVEPLKKARRTAGGLNSLFGSGNSCIRKELDEALEELGQ